MDDSENDRSLFKDVDFSDVEARLVEHIKQLEAATGRGLPAESLGSFEIKFPSFVKEGDLAVVITTTEVSAPAGFSLGGSVMVDRALCIACGERAPDVGNEVCWFCAPTCPKCKQDGAMQPASDEGRSAARLGDKETLAELVGSRHMTCQLDKCRQRRSVNKNRETWKQQRHTKQRSPV